MAARELSWALRDLSVSAAEVDHVLARRLGLRPLDYAAMGHVMSAEEPIGPAELSQRLGISTGSGTELLDRLERAGHVERHRHDGDRRRILVRPVPAAIERILDELSSLIRELDAFATTFTDDEQAVVIRYLRGAAQHHRSYIGGAQ